MLLRQLLARLVALCLLATAAQAQSGAPLRLQDALLQARANASKAVSAQLVARITASRLQAQRSEYLPRVTATGEVRYNAKIAAQLLPGIVVGRPADETVPLAVGTDWVTTAGVRLDQLIYDPARSRRLAATRSALVANQWQARSAEEAVVLLAHQSYLDALKADAELAYAEADLRRRRQQLADLETALAQNRALLTDVNQAKLDVADAEIRIAQQQRDRTTARANLLAAMGQPATSAPTLVLADSLAAMAIPGTGMANGVYADAEALAAQQTEQEALATAETRTILPKLDLVSYYGGQNFSNTLEPFNSDRWFGNSYIGLSINIPLFDGLQRNARAEQARLRVQQLAADRQHLETQRSADAVNAAASLATAEAELPLQQQRLALAAQNRQLAQVRYQQGQVLAKAVLDAEADLADAQQRLVFAQYNLLSAQLELARIENRILPPNPNLP